jgi:hypothetical protein
MHQKTKILSALGLACVGAYLLAPAGALAGSPLLSGYGGPGTGEQAILGSTLVGGSGGGSGSGGSSGGSTGGRHGAGAASSSATTGGSSASGPSASGAGSARAGQTQSSAGKAVPQRGGGTRAGRAGVSAYVYQSTLRAASYDSPALGVSSGDLLAVVATIATLALLGAVTIRFGRLQA